MWTKCICPHSVLQQDVVYIATNIEQSMNTQEATPLFKVRDMQMTAVHPNASLLTDGPSSFGLQAQRLQRLLIGRHRSY